MCQTISVIVFRSINVINCGNKILTKYIIKQLTKFLPDLINANQTGFVKNKHL